MNDLKKYLPWILRGLIAFFFLFSAFAKIYPSANLALGTFEAKQLIPMGMSEGFASYFSRFIIAAEFSIGIGLLQPHYLKRLVLPAASLMLLLFTLQLSYDWATVGIKDDCGCFGTLMPFNTWESILKNVIALGMLVYLWKLLPGDDKERNFFAYPLLIFTTLAMFMYAGAPIQFTPEQPVVEGSQMEMHSDFNNTTDIDTLEVKDTTNTANAGTTTNNTTPEVVEPPKPKGPKHVVSKFSGFPAYIPSNIRIDDGKKILCMFAAGCEHCQATIKQLTEMRAADPTMPPIHIVFMDEEAEKIPEFFKIAGREYSYRIAPVLEFWKIIDYSRDTPGVCYLYNGNIMYFSDGTGDNEFNAKAFKQALAKEK